MVEMNNDVSTMDILDFVKYINKELLKDNTISVNKLCDKLGIKKSTLRSKMARGGYSYNMDIRQYRTDTITDNTFNNIAEKEINSSDITHNNSNNMIPSDIDIKKLNILLDNLDSLLELINNNMENITNSITLKSKKVAVKSLRINEELYELVKDRAFKSNGELTISSIVNVALLDYLNKYN